MNRKRPTIGNKKADKHAEDASDMSIEQMFDKVRVIYKANGPYINYVTVTFFERDEGVMGQRDKS